MDRVSEFNHRDPFPEALFTLQGNLRGFYVSWNSCRKCRMWKIV